MAVGRPVGEERAVPADHARGLHVVLQRLAGVPRGRERGRQAHRLVGEGREAGQGRGLQADRQGEDAVLARVPQEDLRENGIVLNGGFSNSDYLLKLTCLTSLQ